MALQLKGTVLLFESGEYSYTHIEEVLIALRDFDLTDVAVQYRKNANDFSKFPAWLVSNDYAEKRKFDCFNTDLSLKEVEDDLAWEIKMAAKGEK